MNGDPVGTILSWRSTRDDLDLFALADALEKRGWFFNRLTGTGGGEPGLHVMVSPAHAGVLDDLLADVVGGLRRGPLDRRHADDAGRYA